MIPLIRCLEEAGTLDLGRWFVGESELRSTYGRQQAEKSFITEVKDSGCDA